jgi:hypothetical protein
MNVCPLEHKAYTLIENTSRQRLTGQLAPNTEVLLFLQSVSASRANFHEPSVARENFIAGEEP